MRDGNAVPEKGERDDKNKLDTNFKGLRRKSKGGMGENVTTSQPQNQKTKKKRREERTS